MSKPKSGDSEPEVSSEELVKRYVKPHNKVAREVDPEKDLQKVFDEAAVLYALCYIQHGHYRSAYAVAHPQIEDKDPMRLFVVGGENSKVVINPKVIRHTNHFVDSEEGCMSFPDQGMIVVPRYHKFEVEYLTFNEEKENELELIPQTLNLSGQEAKIWQHEIDHLDGISIYDKPNTHNYSTKHGQPIPNPSAGKHRDETSAPDGV